MMMFLILSMVVCIANAYQTEPEHHVIPYKGNYNIKIRLYVLIRLIINQLKNGIFEKKSQTLKNIYKNAVKFVK